jgi:hypothetical protein
MKYTVEFYRVITVRKEIEADSKEELEKQCKKMKKDVMKNVPSHISETEWEVVKNEE